MERRNNDSVVVEKLGLGDSRVHNMACLSPDHLDAIFLRMIYLEYLKNACEQKECTR